MIKKTIRSWMLCTVPLFGLSPAHAGADLSCSPSLALNSNAFTTCNSLPILDPANDSQVNTALLLKYLRLATTQSLPADRYLWTSNYGIMPFEAAPYIAQLKNAAPSRRNTELPQPIETGIESCGSLEAGKQQFIQAVRTNNQLNQADQTELLQARFKIKDCQQNYPFITMSAQRNIHYRMYASYLNGIIAFYKGDYVTAEKIFQALKTVTDPWLKETSDYMLIRCKLNLAYQSGTNQYGDLNLQKVDQRQLTTFLKQITHYLQTYPKGRYAASARGYLRRAYWLSDRQDLLIKEVVWQINHPASPYYNLDMATLPAEIDRRIFDSRQFNPQFFNDPFFLSIHDLKLLRSSEDSDYRPISWTQLHAQKSHFKSQPELFNYLKALHLYFIQNKSDDALKMIPESPNLNNVLGLSWAVLQGRILDKTAVSKALPYWESLYKQAKNTEQKALFELALYHHYRKQQQADAFIGHQAIISQPNLQRSFIQNDASFTSLKKIYQSTQATKEQKNAALSIYLDKSLVNKHYQQVSDALSALPADAVNYQGYNSNNEILKNSPELSNYLWQGHEISKQLKCPSLKALTTQLSQTPQDLTAQLCMGEFFRSNAGWHLKMYYENDPDTVNRQFSRGAVYRQIIGKDQPGELHAYALYRAIMCYAPSGVNDCEDVEVSKATRKQWYDQLKKRYPDSSWAKSLKYYW